jgi:hypothetical protein
MLGDQGSACCVALHMCGVCGKLHRGLPDSWAADGMELAKLKSDIPYDAMKAGAVTDIDVSSVGVDC